MESKNLSKYCVLVLLLTYFFRSELLGQTKNDTIYLNDQKEIYTVKERQAEPIGGMESFNKWNEENFKRELKTADSLERRKIYVEFVVGVDGILSDFRILKGLGEPYDSEAIRVVKTNPTKWRPAKVGNKPFRQRFNTVIKI
jgi:protein TonB